jgi:hypothetical protein
MRTEFRFKTLRGEKKLSGRRRGKYKNNIKMDRKEII